MNDRLFDVPNLDDLSTEPADYSRLAEVLRVLADYADHKSRAMYLRSAGAVANAINREEEKMQWLYEGLPRWAKW